MFVLIRIGVVRGQNVDQDCFSAQNKTYDDSDMALIICNYANDINGIQPHFTHLNYMNTKIIKFKRKVLNISSRMGKVR